MGAKSTCSDKTLFGFSIASLVFSIITILVGLFWLFIGGVSAVFRNSHASYLANQALSIILMGCFQMPSAIIEMTSGSAACCCGTASRACRKTSLGLASFFRLASLGCLTWLCILSFVEGPYGAGRVSPIYGPSGPPAPPYPPSPPDSPPRPPRPPPPPGCNGMNQIWESNINSWVTYPCPPSPPPTGPSPPPDPPNPPFPPIIPQYYGGSSSSSERSLGPDGGGAFLIFLIVAQIGSVLVLDLMILWQVHTDKTPEGGAAGQEMSGVATVMGRVTENEHPGVGGGGVVVGTAVP